MIQIAAVVVGPQKVSVRSGTMSPVVLAFSPINIGTKLLRSARIVPEISDRELVAQLLSTSWIIVFE